MPIAQSAPQPFEASAVLGSGGGGGGGGGGLTAEADEIVLIDEGNSDTPFLRKYLKDDDGLITGTTDTELDGTTVYAVTGPEAPVTGIAAAFTGLTAEADLVVMRDDGDNSYFLRRFPRTADGTPGAAVDTELDGTTAKGALVGAAVPLGIQAGGPELTVTADRYVAGDSPVAIAAGAEKVIVVAVADDVTVNGAAVPANVGLTFGADGFTTDALTVTIAGSGDALIVEERA